MSRLRGWKGAGAGREWHHIVEREAIKPGGGNSPQWQPHNRLNLISIRRDMHQKCINSQVGTKLLAGLDVLAPEEIDRYMRVSAWIDEHPYDRNLGRRDEHVNPLTPWDDDHVPLPAPSRVLGFSAVPANDDYDQLVRDNLPLDGEDQHVLLADVNVDQFAEADPDWFHGGRHVEYCIRRSDLLARNFDDTWALIRTDH